MRLNFHRQRHVTLLLALAILGFQQQPYHVMAKQTHFLQPSDYLVEGLEETEPAFGAFQGDMYAGLIPIGDASSSSSSNSNNNNTTRGELMFWLFAPHQPAVARSLTIWLNGGPGCSSLSGGVLFENSPVTVPHRPAGYCCSSAQEPLEANPHAWTEATYMLYVEQPAHTGFSQQGVMPQTEKDVARDFVDWLQNFYRVFSDLGLPQFELFLFGER